MSVFSKIGSFFSIRDDEEDLYEEEQPVSNNRVVPLSQAGRRGGTEVSVFSPRGYQDVVDVTRVVHAHSITFAAPLGSTPGSNDGFVAPKPVANSVK